jgi:hypothetical protein
MTTQRPTRKCCAKHCHNPAAPGRRTCGKHGKRRRSSRSISRMPASYFLNDSTTALTIMKYCPNCDQCYIKGDPHECSTRAGWIQIDRSALLAEAGALADRMVDHYRRCGGEV